jgi:hypothetical protein
LPPPPSVAAGMIFSLKILSAKENEALLYGLII